MLYVHPDGAGVACNDAILGFGAPIDMSTGNLIFNGPAWNSASDDF